MFKPYALIGLLAFAGLLACEKTPDTPVKLTGNGNVLFYNSPAATPLKEDLFIGYLTREGRAEAVRYNPKTGALSAPLLIHDYTDRVAKSKAFADDHAAPALLYNAQSDTLWAATAYHTSAVHIYKYDAGRQEFDLHKTVEGKFTYPRLINHGANIHILLRDRPAQARRGDLIALSSADDFLNKTRLIQAQTNEVIYASRPYVSGAVLAVTYSTLKYTDRQLHGWGVSVFDMDDNFAPTHRDLADHLPADIVSNRPTAITRTAKGWHVATTITQTKHRQMLNAYNRPSRNVVKVLRLADLDNSAAQQIHSAEVDAGYYPTSVDFTAQGEAVYFSDGPNPASNAIAEHCLIDAPMRYPNAIEGGLIFAAQNTPDYSIRDFNMSLYFCPSQHPKIKAD